MLKLKRNLMSVALASATMMLAIGAQAQAGEDEAKAKEQAKEQAGETAEAYFAEIDGTSFEFDLFLGSLAGLITARAVFQTAETRDGLEVPFTAIEVTDDPAFDGSNLFRSDFATVRSAVQTDADAMHAHLTRIGEIAGENE